MLSIYVAPFLTKKVVGWFLNLLSGLTALFVRIAKVSTFGSYRAQSACWTPRMWRLSPAVHRNTV